MNLIKIDFRIGYQQPKLMIEVRKGSNILTKCLGNSKPFITCKVVYIRNLLPQKVVLGFVDDMIIIVS